MRILISGATHPFLLYLLMFGFDEKDIFIVNQAIPPKIRDKINAIFFQTRGTKKDVEVRNQILKLRFKLFFKTLFSKTYVYGNDHLPFFSFPFYENENTYLLEDGIANYRLHQLPPLLKDDKNITRYEKFKNHFLYGDYNQYMNFGRNSNVSKIFLTNLAKIPEEIKSKVEILDIKKLWNLKSESEKKKILDIYSISEETFYLVNEDSIILLTQPFSQLNMLTLDEEIRLYKEILSKYKPENVIIKQHPVEKKDYSQYLPEYQFIDADFPIEFLLLLDVKFKKIVTITSTGVLCFDEEKVEFLGTEIHQKLLDKLGKITMDSLKNGE